MEYTTSNFDIDINTEQTKYRTTILSNIDYDIINIFSLISQKHPNLISRQLITKLAARPNDIVGTFYKNIITVKTDIPNITLYTPINPRFFPFYFYFIKNIIPNHTFKSIADFSSSSYLCEILLYLDRTTKTNYANNYYKIFREIKTTAYNNVIRDIKSLENVYNTTVNYNSITNITKSFDFVSFECGGMCASSFELSEYINLLYSVIHIINDGGCLLMSIKYIKSDIMSNIITYLSQFFKSLIYYNHWVGFRGNVLLTGFKKIKYDEHISKGKKLLNNDKTMITFTQSEQFIKFFTKIYNKANDIKFIDTATKFYKTYVCKTESDCINLDNAMAMIKQNCERQLKNDVMLCKKYGLDVRQEYKKSFKITIMNMMQYLYDTKQDRYDFLVTKNTSQYTIKIINNYVTNDILKKNENNLRLAKFCIDSRNIKKWSDVTFQINIRRYLNKYIREKIGITVTRAFTKLYDILNEYDLIDFSKSETRSLHTCEAPGHFINSLNHFIKSNNPNHKFTWYSNSLNPDNEDNKKKYGTMFADEYGFIKKYNDNWIWGVDNTGDITNPLNIKYFGKRFGTTIDLFTSDCGLGAQSSDEMLEQESVRSILNYSQVLIGLLVTKLGGHMVLKIYLPFNIPITISLIYLCYLHFTNLSLIKQLSGSSGSSEVYLVASNKYRHLEKNNEDQLINFISKYNPDYALFDNIDEQFINQLNKISTELTKLTIDYIHRSFFYYDNSDILQQHSQKYFIKAKNIYCQNWVQINKLRKIPPELKL